MNRYQNFLKTFAVVSVICIGTIGCFGPIIKFQKTTTAHLSDDTQPKQEIDNISVEVKLLPDDTYEKKSYYKQPFRVYSEGGLLTTAGYQDVELPVAYFGAMTAFEVTIINNTDHILRMRDSRIIFVDPDFDEPIMALDKPTITDDFEVLPVYKAMMDAFKKTSPEIKTSFYKTQLDAALANITKKIKFINGFNREIMPKMKMTGIVLFNIESTQISQGKVSFIDMVSQTDEAGNPTKKVSFDFRVSTLDRYWKYNSEVSKEWAEIDKKEYEDGQKSVE